MMCADEDGESEPAGASRLFRWRVELLAGVAVVLGLGCLASACSGSSTAETTPTAAETSTAGHTASPVQPTPSATRPTVHSTAYPRPAQTASPDAGPPGPEPNADMRALQAEMERIIARAAIDGRYAVAVTDLQTGETVGVNASRSKLTACIANLFLLIMTMRDVQRGDLELDVVSDLIDTTIWGSDAYSAHQIYGIVGDGDVLAGVRRVHGFILELGLHNTVVDHPPAYGDDSIHVSDDNWTTALDVNQALWDLYHGNILDEATTEELLNRLTHVKPGLNYLIAYSSGGRVSHKNGFFQINDGSWVDNDAGIVRFEKNGHEYAYAISYFSDFVETKYGDIGVGQALAAAAWAYFDEHYD